MTYSISKIDGLSPQAVAKLKSKGIRTTEAFLEKARTPKGRKALAAATGISEQLLLEAANVADYMRVPGMGNAKAGLFRAAGVNTLREFTYRNPERLAQAAKDVNDKRKLVRVLPSKDSIAQLIDRARKLELKIKY
jgi:predicted RecB family nuclease